MARFRKDPDPRFWRLNRSIEFDWRLAPYDIDQSRAHAQGAARIGVLDDDELRQIDDGLERVGETMGMAGFRFVEADEDIHMAIERRLTELIGPLGGKLHTGRSRNDQVATDVAMAVQSHSLRAVELLRAVMGRLVDLAESHRDWPMPGYTHLQRAQPVYLGHHLLAYFWMLSRDVWRFQLALHTASVMPLGSGALAGVNWEIDRRAVADELGFDYVSPNSIDGVSNRDFVLDYLAAATGCAIHLSRLGSRDRALVEQRVRLLRARRVLLLGLEHHAPEEEPRLRRAAARQGPRVAADCAALVGMHALPLTYSKDMQEDKEPLFDADRHGRALPRRDRGDAGRDRVRPRAAGGGVGRRDARRHRHRRPAGPRRRAVPRGARHRRRPRPRRGRAQGRSLSELRPEELRERSEHLDDSYYEVLKRSSWLESKRIEGGTGSEALGRQIELARETLEAVKARVLEERS